MTTSKTLAGLLVSAFFTGSLGLVIYVEKALETSACHGEQTPSKATNCTNPSDPTEDLDRINNLPAGKTREGAFVEAILNGNGTYVFFDGRSYVGELENNSYEGVGYLIFPDGTRYEGQFKNGEYHGQGALYAQDGSILVNGEWDSGNLIVSANESEATTLLSECSGTDPKTWHACYGQASEDGHTYIGQWQDGRPNGRGVAFSSDGDVYTGSFLEGDFHGKGELTFPDGRKYVGEFLEGEPHGRGVEFSKDGTVFKQGKWIEGTHQVPLSRI